MTPKTLKISKIWMKRIFQTLEECKLKQADVDDTILKLFLDMDGPVMKLMDPFILML